MSDDSLVQVWMGENLHRIRPIFNHHAGSRYLSRNCHGVRIPIVPSSSECERGAQIAIYVKGNRGALNGKISSHLRETLSHDPNQCGHDHESCG